MTDTDEIKPIDSIQTEKLEVGNERLDNEVRGEKENPTSLPAGRQATSNIQPPTSYVSLPTLETPSYQELYAKDPVAAREALIKCYEETKNVAATAKIFKTTRKVVYRALEKQARGDLTDTSRAPKTVHNRIPQEVEREIIVLRSAQGLGHRQISERLRQEGIIVSERAVGQVLERAQTPPPTHRADLGVQPLIGVEPLKESPRHDFWAYSAGQTGAQVTEAPLPGVGAPPTREPPPAAEPDLEIGLPQQESHRVPHSGGRKPMAAFIASFAVALMLIIGGFTVWSQFNQPSQSQSVKIAADSTDSTGSNRLKLFARRLVTAAATEVKLYTPGWISKLSWLKFPRDPQQQAHEGREKALFSEGTVLPEGRSLGEVLAMQDLPPLVLINAETDFKEFVLAEKDVTVIGTLTAPNIVYEVTAGTGVTVTGDPQRPVISAEASTATAFGTFTVGSSNITAGSASDTLELAAGSNVTLSADTATNTITISATSPTVTASGWTDSGTLITLTTTTDNVNIGGTTDLAKLGVVGDTDEIQLLVRANATQTSNLAVFENSSGTDLLVIDSAGNLGIGNSAPTRPLHVTGNARITDLVSCDSIDTDASGNLVCGTDAGGAAVTLQAAYNNDADGSDTIIALTAADDSLIFRNPAAAGTDSGYLLRLDQLNTGAVTGLEIAQAGTGNAFAVYDDGTFTDSTPFVVAADGNVGIGTGSPGSLLHVFGSGLPQVKVDGPSESRINLAVGGTNHFIINHNGTTGTIGTTATGGDLSVQTGGSTRMTILGSNGNVGIGTSTPGARFEVGDGTDGAQISSAGDLTFVDADGAASITGPAGGALTISAANSQALNLTTTTAGNISLDPAGAGDITLVTANASGSNLTVTGLAAGSGSALCLDGSNNVITCTVGTGGISGSGTVNYVSKFTSASTIGDSTIFDNGNVGIGMTVPTAFLHLAAGTSSKAPLKFTAGSNLTTPEAGAIEFDGTDLYYTTSTPTRRTVCNSSGNCAGVGGSVAGSGTANRVAYWTASNTIAADDDFFFDGTNVGIGLTLPTQKLDVNGNIGIQTGTDADNVIALTAQAGAPSGSLFWGSRTLCDSSNNCTSSSSVPWSSLTNPTTNLALSHGTNTTTMTTGATTQTFWTMTGTSFTTGELMDLTGTWAPSDGSDNEAIDINLTYTPTSASGTFRGVDLNVTEGANALANTLYGLKLTTDNSANTSTGTHSIYGGHFAATGKLAGTTTAVGLYATATGADSNYAAIFEAGNVGIGDTTPAYLFTVGSGDLFGIDGAANTSLVWEGSVADDFETSLTVVNPTADLIYRLADAAAGTYDVCTTAANCAGSAGNTLQAAYNADTDGSDSIIALTTADDSLIFRNPATGGTDSGFTLQVDNIATAMTTANYKNLNVTQAGTINTTAASLTNYGGYFSNTSTESAGANTLTNVGLYATASGADANYAAIFEAGNVGIGTTAPSSAFNVVGVSTFGGNLLASASPTAGASSQTITTLDSTGDVGQGTDIVLSTDGFGVIAYYDVTNTALKVLKCGNNDCSSGNTTTIVDGDTGCPTGCASGDSVGQAVAIVLSTDGFPIISYLDTTNTALKVVKCGNAACSSGNTYTIVDGAAGCPTGCDTDSRAGTYTDVKIGYDGLPIIAYQQTFSDDGVTAAEDPLVVKCGNASCSSGNTYTNLVATNNRGRYIQILISTTGLPILFWQDGSVGDLDAWNCTTASCSAGALNTLVTTDDVGYYLAAVLRPDGTPFLAYYNLSSGTGRYLSCGTTSCSTTFQTISISDGSSGGGQFNSLAVGTDGLVVGASHRASGSLDLVIGKCRREDCQHDDQTAIDTTGDVGKYTSIAVGLDGRPLVTYYDLTNGDLKVAKCADGGCVATSNGSFSGGINIGSLGQFFNNVFAASYWGKAFQIEGFDLAEMYTVDDESVGAGDIVATRGDDSILTRSHQAYQGTVLGVVSTQPGITLADWEDNDDPHKRPVALAGRVPVKVSTSSAAISPGDYLTSSDEVGRAMKATRAGQMIGKALESWTPESGRDTVLTFVNLTYADPSDGVIAMQIGEDGSLLLEDATIEAIAKEVGEVLKQKVTEEAILSKLTTKTISAPQGENLVIALAEGSMLDIRAKEASASAVTIDSLGNATFAGTLTAARIKAESIEGMEVLTNRIDVLSAIVEATSEASVDTAVEELGATGGLTIAKNVTFEGESLFQKLVTFISKVVFKDEVRFETVPTFARDSGGFVVVGEGQQYAEVKFDKEYMETPVVSLTISMPDLSETAYEDMIVAGKCIVPTTRGDCQAKLLEEVLLSDVKYAVTNTSKKGFVVVLNKLAPVELRLSWSAISVKDPATVRRSASEEFAVPSLTPTPAPSPATPHPAQSEEPASDSSPTPTP